METVEVVIRIPKDLYEGIECRNGELETEYVCDELMKAVDNGTVLPKRHGDLKDIAEIERLWQKGDYDSIVSALLFAPTVIETDKDGD